MMTTFQPTVAADSGGSMRRGSCCWPVDTVVGVCRVPTGVRRCSLWHTEWSRVWTVSYCGGRWAPALSVWLTVIAFHPNTYSYPLCGRRSTSSLCWSLYSWLAADHCCHGHCLTSPPYVATLSELSSFSTIIQVLSSVCSVYPYYGCASLRTRTVATN